MSARVRRVLISRELVTAILTDGYQVPSNVQTRVERGLPAGAQLLSAGIAQDGQLILVFQHDSFDEWDRKGQPAPVQQIVVTETRL